MGMGRAHRGQARSLVPLAQRGGNAMWTTGADAAPNATMHYAVNMFPISVSRPDSPWLTRQPFLSFATGTGPGANVRAHGEFSKADGTKVIFFLTSDDGIWTFSGGTYSRVVTTANLTTATITVAAATHYWCVFNNTVVFNDETNQPWTWDGTSGAGGLTLLTNAPTTCYGRPAVYYAKLFFIKKTARDTIVWSEEAAANTGYEASGYSNVWKLGQTGTNPLVALAGTNEGLYYFRERSIGVIRGAVNSDFVTSGVHDAVSSTTGTVSRTGVAVVGQNLWFADQQGIPTLLPGGGSPQRLMDEFDVNSSTTSEPFGFDLVEWSRATGAQNATIEVFAVPVQQRMTYTTIWFNVPASEPTAARAALVVSEDTRMPVGWVVPYIGDTAHASMGVVTDNGLALPYVLAATTGKILAFSTSTGGDRNHDNTVQSTTFRLIGAPLGASDTVDCHYDEMDVLAGVSEAMTLSVQTLTSRRDTASLASAAQSLALTGADVRDLTRYRVGLDQSGRWVRPVFSASTTDTGGFGLSLAGWTVLAVPSKASDTP